MVIAYRGKYFTGSGWSNEYPDAQKFHLRRKALEQAQALSREMGDTGRTEMLRVVAHYGTEDEETIMYFQDGQLL